MPEPLEVSNGGDTLDGNPMPSEGLAGSVMALLADRERLRSKLDLARDGLNYVLDHEPIGTCLCSAGKSVVEASLRLSDPERRDRLA